MVIKRSKWLIPVALVPLLKVTESSDSRPSSTKGFITSKRIVDFPDPETPVKQVRAPTGISNDTFFRLWAEAFFTFKNPLLSGRRFSGKGICFFPDKYRPVSE